MKVTIATEAYIVAFIYIFNLHCGGMGSAKLCVSTRHISFHLLQWWRSKVIALCVCVCVCECMCQVHGIHFVFQCVKDYRQAVKGLGQSERRTAIWDRKKLFRQRACIMLNWTCWQFYCYAKLDLLTVLLDYLLRTFSQVQCSLADYSALCIISRIKEDHSSHSLFSCEQLQWWMWNLVMDPKMASDHYSKVGVRPWADGCDTYIYAIAWNTMQYLLKVCTCIRTN